MYVGFGEVGGEDQGAVRSRRQVNGDRDFLALQVDLGPVIDRLNVAMNGVWVCRHGATGDDRSRVDLKGKEITITVDLSAGPHSAMILTTDLTEAYVQENSAYST